MEKMLLAEVAEVWNYQACLEQESTPRIRAICERFLDYEMGHVQVVLRLFKDVERRDPAELLGDGKLPPQSCHQVADSYALSALIARELDNTRDSGGAVRAVVAV